MGTRNEDSQLPYWDVVLWNSFFKDVNQHTFGRWTIVFASNGSPYSRFQIKGAPIRLIDKQRVTLMASLYHVVLSDNFEEVFILDNTLERVPGGELRLLAQS